MSAEKDATDAAAAAKRALDVAGAALAEMSIVATQGEFDEKSKIVGDELTVFNQKAQNTFFAAAKANTPAADDAVELVRDYVVTAETVNSTRQTLIVQRRPTLPA